MTHKLVCMHLIWKKIISSSGGPWMEGHKYPGCHYVSQVPAVPLLTHGRGISHLTRWCPDIRSIPRPHPCPVPHSQSHSVHSVFYRFHWVWNEQMLFIGVVQLKQNNWLILHLASVFMDQNLIFNLENIGDLWRFRSLIRI